MTNQSMFGVGSRLVFDALMNSAIGSSCTRHAGAVDGWRLQRQLHQLWRHRGGEWDRPAGGSAVLYSGKALSGLRPWSLVIAIVIYIVMALSRDEEEGKLAMKEGAGCATCWHLLLFLHPISDVAFPHHAHDEQVLLQLRPGTDHQRTGPPADRQMVGNGTGTGLFRLHDRSVAEPGLARMDLTEFYASIVPNMPNVGAMQGERCRPCEQLLLRRGEMPMNRATRFSRLPLPMLTLSSTAGAEPFRTPVPDARPVLLAALQASDGTAHGVR